MSTTPVANLPPVSMTPVANFAASSPCVVDTGGKFATVVNNTGGKFAAGVNDASGKLPPVSTAPAAKLRISPRIFEKNSKRYKYSGAGGNLIHEKNQKQKIS